MLCFISFNERESLISKHEERKKLIRIPGIGDQFMFDELDTPMPDNLGELIHKRPEDDYKLAQGRYIPFAAHLRGD
ncbi:MAG: hypothetical protein DMD82_03175 [Candidatus Rokuibacteriota bacterium]|nr:MAG: hypothetical protein DMD82_03175 [Candidatus Rokubacteria bacterium]